MSGIYIHIPFCKSKCAYCDFFSVAILSQKSQYVDFLCKEMELQKNYLESENIETIYFGGGTPSLLSEYEIFSILNSVYKNFSVSQNAEITFEVNPEGLTLEYLKILKNFSINRLSVGVQSFFEEDLQFLRRSHSQNEAKIALQNAINSGFSNISVDLIYGLPNSDFEKFAKNLEIVFEFQIPHLSCYHLTFEENTLLFKQLREKKFSQISDQESWNIFEKMIILCESKSYEHYEISNFSLKNYISKHNFNYWQETKYLGLGAAAHSFNKISRQWNVQNIKKYFDSLSKSLIPCEIEFLTFENQYNEFLMTSLRTFLGINFDDLKLRFGEKLFNKFSQKIQKFIQNSEMKIADNKVFLTNKGKFVSDSIFAELFE